LNNRSICLTRLNPFVTSTSLSFLENVGKHVTIQMAFNSFNGVYYYLIYKKILSSILFLSPQKMIITATRKTLLIKKMGNIPFEGEKKEKKKKN